VPADRCRAGTGRVFSHRVARGERVGAHSDHGGQHERQNRGDLALAKTNGHEAPFLSWTPDVSAGGESTSHKPPFTLAASLARPKFLQNKRFFVNRSSAGRRRWRPARSPRG